MGIGGAFIAVSDDATAASWNPAGLAQLKRPEISIVGNLFLRRDHSVFEAYPEASMSNSITRYHLNYLSLVFPGRLFGRNLIFSLNYQHLYDMNLQFHRSWPYQYEDNEAHKYDLDITWDYQRKGALFAISPALAIQIIPSLALGLTINFWPKDLGIADNGWTKEFSTNKQGTIEDEGIILPFSSLTCKNYRYTFSGTNFHFGFHWQINSVLKLGGVMKTSFSAELEREVTELSIDEEEYIYEPKPKETQTLTMPPSYGLGLAVRFSDHLTLSMDLYRTEWDRHRLKTKEGTFSMVTNEIFDSSDVKPTHHVRLGMEYLLITRRKILALRSGLLYDPDPSRDQPIDFYGFSAGSGIAWKHLAIDFAYQFRFARNVSIIYFQGAHDQDDIDQHFVYLSMIYYL
jgi:long-subunit fatty acid transport protein